MQTVFITDTDKGIGLEFVKQYTQDNWKVLASYLGPDISKDLQHIAKIHSNVKLIPLDITDVESIQSAIKHCEMESIDILINNAGIFSNETLGHLDPHTMEKIYKTNAIGPLMMCQYFQHFLKPMGTIVSISSKTGSIGGDTTENMIGYRMSKAALNMGMQEVSRKLAPKGIKVLLLAPGYVKTDMSPDAQLDVSESVRSMRKVIYGRADLISGGFYDRHGKQIPW
jgi:NAD(P)-dependent dehydrogenase (short-subunit alcohol dehydrogenase family)